jgi:hypothetical protein
MSQLVREGIQIYDIAREAWLDESAVREKFGVTPGQIPISANLRGCVIVEPVSANVLRGHSQFRSSSE